jgi:hypothetical protein
VFCQTHRLRPFQLHLARCPLVIVSLLACRSPSIASSSKGCRTLSWNPEECTYVCGHTERRRQPECTSNQAYNQIWPGILSAEFDHWTPFQKDIPHFQFSLSLSLSNISLSSLLLPLSHNAPQICRTPPYLARNRHWPRSLSTSTNGSLPLHASHLLEDVLGLRFTPLKIEGGVFGMERE